MGASASRKKGSSTGKVTFLRHVLKRLITSQRVEISRSWRGRGWLGRFVIPDSLFFWRTSEGLRQRNTRVSRGLRGCSESSRREREEDRVGQHISDHLTRASNLYVSAKCIFSSFIECTLLLPTPLMPNAPRPLCSSILSHLASIFLLSLYGLHISLMASSPRPTPLGPLAILTFFRRTLKCRWQNNSSKRFKVKSIPRNHIF